MLLETQTLEEVREKGFNKLFLLYNEETTTFVINLHYLKLGNNKTQCQLRCLKLYEN